MSGRIGRAFETARRERRGAFVPFLTSGFPDLAESDRLVHAVCEEGADVLELGVPFSDPIADGPTIQRTTESALRAGATLAHVLAQAARVRSRHETPLVLMSYLNPILRYGADRFARDAGRASGFLYVVARLGVTGRGAGDAAIESVLERCRAHSPLPRCLGFGIDLETPLERYRGKAEGVVVGSSLLDVILAERDPRSREEGLRRFARGFRAKLPG